MTDSKTPEWAREEAGRIATIEWLTIAERLNLSETISQALLSAYERGRKEGIEEAAEVADGFEADAKTTNRSPHRVAEDIASAIRQLLEVKG